MSFRSKQQIIRQPDGQYVKGRWVKGGDTTMEIMASVQPATNDDTQNLPEGKRIERAVRIYTDALLNVDGADNNGDVLVWQGRHYRVIAVAPYRSNVISHYRYLAAEAER